MARTELLKSENADPNPLDQLSPQKYQEIQQTLLKGLQEMAKDKTALEEGRQDHKDELRKFWESPDLDIPIRGVNRMVGESANTGSKDELGKSSVYSFGELSRK